MSAAKRLRHRVVNDLSATNEERCVVRRFTATSSASDAQSTAEFALREIAQHRFV
jgi:hypothetical protein